MKRIVLCADDYGQAPNISRGICHLVHNGRLSATSCIVNTPHWLEHANWLLPLHHEIDIGLHFNLTEGKAISKEFRAKYGENLPSLTTLMTRAFLRLLDRATIVAELEAQIDRFVEGLGYLPHFIDGHQHIHQFPVIRHAFIDVYLSRLRENKSYIRLVNPKLKFSDVLFKFKKVVIDMMGAKPFEQLLVKYDIPHNSTFAGIYNFSSKTDYRSVFLNFLPDIQNGGLIMCHPGTVAPDKNDSIAENRKIEYDYFNSNQFLIDCYSHGITFIRFKATSQPKPEVMAN